MLGNIFNREVTRSTGEQTCVLELVLRCSVREVQGEEGSLRAVGGRMINLAFGMNMLLQFRFGKQRDGECSHLSLCVGVCASSLSARSTRRGRIIVCWWQQHDLSCFGMNMLLQFRFVNQRDGECSHLSLCVGVCALSFSARSTRRSTRRWNIMACCELTSRYSSDKTMQAKAPSLLSYFNTHFKQESSSEQFPLPPKLLSHVMSSLLGKHWRCSRGVNFLDLWKILEAWCLCKFRLSRPASR